MRWRGIYLTDSRDKVLEAETLVEGVSISLPTSRRKASVADVIGMARMFGYCHCHTSPCWVVPLLDEEAEIGVETGRIPHGQGREIVSSGIEISTGASKDVWLLHIYRDRYSTLSVGLLSPADVPLKAESARRVGRASPDEQTSS